MGDFFSEKIVTGEENKGIERADEYEKVIKVAVENQPGIKLERSQFFRYPNDMNTIASFVEERIQTGEKINLLEIGVGNMEELSSYLAAIKKVADKYGRNLKDLVNTELVELRAKGSVIPNFGLGKVMGVFINSDPELSKKAPPVKPPEDYKTSFYLDEDEGVNKFAPEIQAYIEGLVSDDTKAHFGRSIEDHLAIGQGQSDVVACNNVLQYLGGMGHTYQNPFNKGPEGADLTKFKKVVRDIAKMVKEGGLLIMHVDVKGGDRKGRGAENVLESIEGFTSAFDKVGPGIYRRKVGITQDVL